MYVHISSIIFHLFHVLDYVVVDDPMDTTVCEGGSATFTCVIFIPFGILSSPGWLRNSTTVDMMRHTVTSNLTGGASVPIHVSSTVTVSNVTVLDDDGIPYQCGLGSAISSRATLNVVGKYLHIPCIANR